MEKTQVYLPKEELDALRKAATRRSGSSVAERPGGDPQGRIEVHSRRAGRDVGRRAAAAIDRARRRSRRALMRHGKAAFVDSGAWIALALSRDPFHPQAREQWDVLH